MSSVAVHKNGNSKFLQAERRTNGSSSTMPPYMNGGGDKVVTGKPPLKNREANGTLNKANSNNKTTKYQTITNGKNAAPTNEPTKTNSLKKKIFTKGRNGNTLVISWKVILFCRALPIV